MGGGGGGQQSVTQEFKPPEYTRPGWQQYLGASQVLSQRPYEESGLPQVSPWNDFQDTSGRLAYDMALYGTPQGNAANSAFMNAAQGNYANPWAQNLYGVATGQDANAYTDQMIQQNADNMAQAFATGTAAQTDAAAAMNGAYGGSAYQQMQQGNAAALAKQVGQMATSTRQAQHQSDIQNQLAANAQGGQMWQGDIANILAGAQGGLAGNADYRQSLTGLMGAGNSMNNYVQQLLNQYNNEWQTQQGYDGLMNDQYGAALSRASGSYGGSTTTQPGMSSLAGLLGLGAGAAGMYSLFK